VRALRLDRRTTSGRSDGYRPRSPCRPTLGRPSRAPAASGPATAPLVPVADRVLYWLVEDRLSELTPTYGSLFLEARDRAQQTVDSLWRHPPHRPHLIHGDLVPSNVIVSGARLTPIDFRISSGVSKFRTSPSHSLRCTGLLRQRLWSTPFVAATGRSDAGRTLIRPSWPP